MPPYHEIHLLLCHTILNIISQYCTMQNTDPHIMQHPTNPTTSNPITQSHTIKCHVTQDPSVTCVMWHGILCHMCCDNIRLHTVLHTIPYYVIPYHTIPYHAIPSTRAECPTPLPYHIRGRLERHFPELKRGDQTFPGGRKQIGETKLRKKIP